MKRSHLNVFLWAHQPKKRTTFFFLCRCRRRRRFCFVCADFINWTYVCTKLYYTYSIYGHWYVRRVRALLHFHTLFNSYIYRTRPPVIPYNHKYSHHGFWDWFLLSLWCVAFFVFVLCLGSVCVAYIRWACVWMYVFACYSAHSIYFVTSKWCAAFILSLSLIENVWMCVYVLPCVYVCVHIYVCSCVIHSHEPQNIVRFELPPISCQLFLVSFDIYTLL